VSFTDLEIAAEFDSASRMGREFFDGDSYSFRRLGKLDGDDFQKLTDRLRSLKWYRANKTYAQALNRAWKAAHPERVRELKQKSVAHRMKVDPKGQRAMRRRRKQKWEAKNRDKVLEQGRSRYHRTKTPATAAAANVRAKAQYLAIKENPAALEALRKYKREWARAKAASL
jgi:hypothetical protein